MVKETFRARAPFPTASPFHLLSWLMLLSQPPREGHTLPRITGGRIYAGKHLFWEVWFVFHNKYNFGNVFGTCAFGRVEFHFIQLGVLISTLEDGIRGRFGERSRFRVVASGISFSRVFVCV